MRESLPQCQQSCKMKRQTDKTNAPQSTQSIIPHAYPLYLSLTSPGSWKLGSHGTDRCGLLIIDLVEFILQKYSIKISHQNTHNFDVHFRNGKKSESPALFH